MDVTTGDSRIKTAHISTWASLALAMLVITGCSYSQTPTSPPPPATPTIASAYILPGAVSLNDWAFGDEPVVIYTDEQLRWVNADVLTHRVVADSPGTTDFRNTEDLRTGDGQSFVMTKAGTTRIHCSIHPNMTGTLIVRER